MKDHISGNFIGKGELPTKQFLMEYFDYQIFRCPKCMAFWDLHCFFERNSFDFYKKKEGIYPQVPILDLINNDDLQNLAESHKKSSVDLVMILDIGNDKCTVCVRVQGLGHGHGSKKGKLKGDHKAKFDSVQKRMLQNNGNYVVDINYHECHTLFKKDILNEKSMEEIKQSFKYCFPLE